MREESRSGCAHWFRDVLDAVPTGIVAGGALRDYFQRRPLESDVDVFFKSMEGLEEGIRSIEAADAEKIYDHSHVRGYLLNHRHIQLIKNHFFDGPEETIDRFDFTVCCAAIDYMGRLAIHPNFFEDLAGRRLEIHNLSNPVSTFARVQKYVEKGFKASHNTLFKIAKAMQEVDLENPSENSLKFYQDATSRR